MFGIGSTEILIIGGVVLLLFGGAKLPQLGSSMGKAITNFKKGLKEGKEEGPEGNENQGENQVESVEHKNGNNSRRKLEEE